jgi:hypothetical protein
LSALITYTSSPNKIITDNTPELLDDLKRIGIRFFVGGSHAYRERLSNNYEPNDLDIVVLGAENVAIIRKMLEKKDRNMSMKMRHFHKTFSVSLHHSSTMVC